MDDQFNMAWNVENRYTQPYFVHITDFGFMFTLVVFLV